MIQYIKLNNTNQIQINDSRQAGVLFPVIVLEGTKDED